MLGSIDWCVEKRLSSREKQGKREISLGVYMYVCMRAWTRWPPWIYFTFPSTSSPSPPCPRQSSGIPRSSTPLDTGKTFTALYNYLDRDSMVLPHLHLRLDLLQRSTMPVCTHIRYPGPVCARTRVWVHRAFAAWLRWGIMRGRAAFGARRR